MADKDKGESVLSKFSNQDPASGGYGGREDEALATFTKPRTSAAVKAKKNKAAKKARKKNRK